MVSYQLHWPLELELLAEILVEPKDVSSAAYLSWFINSFTSFLRSLQLRRCHLGDLLRFSILAHELIMLLLRGRLVNNAFFILIVIIIAKVEDDDEQVFFIGEALMNQIDHEGNL